MEHRRFTELPNLIPEGSLLIVNNSQVIPARLQGKIGSRRCEIFLLEPTEKDSSTNWKAIGKPTRHFFEGLKIEFPGDVTGEIKSFSSAKGTSLLPFDISFDLPNEMFHTWLLDHGIVPLPPYIARQNPLPASKSSDKDRYQTVYAGNDLGSVAAPTAGLHFTHSLIDSLKRKSISIESITLHVGGGTFLPVKAEDPALHIMHKERYVVPKRTTEAIAQTKAQGGLVIAVGTTSFRCLEDFYTHNKNANQWTDTDIFIRPKNLSDTYKSKIYDGIITNFHQPESTLVMLVSALIGYESWRQYYQCAIESKYRFLSYGDSNLIWLNG